MKPSAAVHPPLLFFLLLTIPSSFNVGGLAAAVTNASGGSRKLTQASSPFTAKASLIRYWKIQVSSSIPSSFFLDKASPLGAVQLAKFSALADQNTLSTQLSAFCKEARLLCFPDVATSLEKHSKDVNFAEYKFQNFTNYGTDRLAGVDSFKNYTNDEDSPVDTFRRYSRRSVNHDDKFTNYALGARLVDQKFNTYGTKATGGTGGFENYNGEDVNIPGITFTSYSDSTNGRTQDFKTYSRDSNGGSENFTSYGKTGNGATDVFSNYGNPTNGVDSTFNNYGETGNGATDNFTSYAPNGNIPTNTFKTYARGGNGETETFTTYGSEGNAPTNRFGSYGSGKNDITQTFTSYGFDGNVPTNDFTSYGSDGNEMNQTFTSYDSLNSIENNFTSYVSGGNGVTQSFTSYGFHSNVPTNNFTSYGSGENGTTTFASYRDQSNIGDDSFESYAEGSAAVPLGFTNYGQSNNVGTDTFKGYAKDSKPQPVDFKTYGPNSTFKDYAKTGVTFADYRNGTGSGSPLTTTKKANSRWVEPGKFFREKMLKTGTVMPMPNIKDKMPKRSFLPRTILSKLPFSTSKIDELKKIFHAADGSGMSKILGDALRECERAPSPGETKRCVGSGEDMIDFATSVLGRNVVVRSTENTQGSGRSIMIGAVTGINGGEITKSVSCHQSLYPYLLYYCHSVPKVRVYKADILDPKSNTQVNHGVAICHIDTSTWSQNHGAFLALGSGPGKIEVCHWIFENDMTWTIFD